MSFIFFLGMLLAFTPLVSCEEDSDPPKEIMDDNSDTIPADTVPEITALYISTQAEFDRYKNLKFLPGAHILFAAGKSFNGQFAPQGSGTGDNPIRVSAYNPETKEIFWDNIDNKPIINGNGLVNSVFYLHNVNNWIVNNLEITNTNGSDEDQGDLRGIHVVQEDVGIGENITIRQCYIHDVNGKVEGKLRGGIHIHVLGKSVPTRFNNVLIEDNYISTVGGVGIGNSSSWGSVNADDYYPWENYVVRNNRVEYTGRNGIIVRDGINPLAEYNVIAYSSRYSTGHNIFNFNTKGCIFQYNEAYGNTGDWGDKDRGGFDADYNAENTIFQYNYSHDNHWLCGIMRKYNKGVTIRYNLGINDRVGAYEFGFPSDTGLVDLKIYNNTHYFGSGIKASPFASPSKQRTPINMALHNNIFYFEEAATWSIKPDESCTLSHNLFYNVEALGTNNLTSDPQFVGKGSAPVDIDMTDPERLAAYKLKETSPCVDAGIRIENNGGLDFWGNKLDDNKPDIGAYER